ncbi:MAG: signal peptide peptidase SppA [Balneolia bacterium]|nr:signal peptide peptidase SppA [Balneolia bacterium]
MNFIKSVLSVLVGLVIFFTISFLLLIGIIAIFSSSDPVTVEDNSLLVINLDGTQLLERSAPDDFNIPIPIPLIGSVSERSAGLDDLRKAIRSAAESDKISGIYLQAGTVFGGMALLQELRNELEEFKENSGKFIVSYSPIYSEGGYYLSSVADEVYIHPVGGMDFSGMASQGIYLKGLFDKLEIEPEVFVVGEYKSAVETFTRTSRSAEDREQTLDFLGDLHRFSIQAVAESRGMEFERVMEINNQLLAMRVEDTVDLGLMDGIYYGDEVRSIIKERIGVDEEDDLELISVSNLNKSGEAISEGRSRDRVAVIYASGEIGSSASSGIYDRRLVREIRRARDNDNVKAVVLRVDSPGGGVLASDQIRRELELLQEEKPLIASMGNVAASGGYWISLPADTIMAQSNTITGSIGIFGLFFNVEGLLTNQLGIETDVVSTGEFSDFPNPTRRMTDIERRMFQDVIEEGYDLFISRVAEGRNMSEEEVRLVAEGRVYSGDRALELGLVDVIGGLDEAVLMAAQLAEIEDDFRIIAYPEQRSFFENLLESMGSGARAQRQIKAELGPFYPVYEQLQQVLRMEGAMARMPYDIIIE